MGTEVDFSNEMYSLLAAAAESSEPRDDHEGHEFPLWDVLKELDRRARRSERDKVKGSTIRDYMEAHPEEVERIRRKHGL